MNRNINLKEKSTILSFLDEMSGATKLPSGINRMIADYATVLGEIFDAHTIKKSLTSVHLNFNDVSEAYSSVYVKDKKDKPKPQAP